MNNTIVGNSGDGIYISWARPEWIANNILALNSGYGIREGPTSSSPTNVWYNLFYANGAGLYLDEGGTNYYTADTLNAGVVECKNNVEGDPMFVDGTAGDYHLQLGSAAVDAGDPTSPLDLDGTRADIGAFYLPQVTAPLITLQPQSQTAIFGSQASFSIQSLGAPPLNYQWRFNATNIAGATSATYSFSTTLATMIVDSHSLSVRCASVSGSRQAQTVIASESGSKIFQPNAINRS